MAKRRKINDGNMFAINVGKFLSKLLTDNLSNKIDGVVKNSIKMNSIMFIRMALNHHIYDPSIFFISISLFFIFTFNFIFFPIM